MYKKRRLAVRKHRKRMLRLKAKARARRTSAASKK